MGISEEEKELKAVLVGLNTGNESEMEDSMEELKNLAEALNMKVVLTAIQTLDHPVASTYIGSGKAEEVSNACETLEADYCIFEDTLSPAQLKNLQKIIKVKIMDRTGLILEIFSRRAQTREAKLQVESANLSYMLPRLIGMWEAIGRQGGASGSKSSKGIGETQLELDRRWIKKRQMQLRKELEEVEHDRSVQRARREKSQLPLVALVGYTNAGKSTIMNRFVAKTEGGEEKKVFEKDMLFATLDTSVRRIATGDRKDFLLSDTVGFVNKLPHSLVKAFRSTLDEIKYADLLVEVVDYSDEKCDEQMRVTLETLKELGAEKIPIIHVMNKADKCDNNVKYPHIKDDKIFMSALDESGINDLLSMIRERVYGSNRVVEFLIPYDKGAVVSELNEKASIIEQDYRSEGTYIKADVTSEIAGRYQMYMLNE